MILFADTSALVKRYIDETGSDSIDDLLARADVLIVSSVTRIEHSSALARRLKDKSLDKKSYEIALTEFNNDFKFIEVIPFNADVETSALNFIKKHGMKTLDAIQLSSAILSKANVFVTSDKKLYEIALKEITGECIYI